MLDIVRQFYDKRLWWVLTGLVLTHVIAASVQGSNWAWAPLIVVGVGTAWLSYSKLEWGLAIAFLELFIGGHGHLIDVDLRGFSLSIREVIFTAVMSVWFIKLISKQVKLSFLAHRDLPFALIGLAILIATINGFANNVLGEAFDDMNGYLTLAYFFPVISLPWTAEQRRLLLLTLAMAAVWITITTLVYVYGFTHLPGLASHELYTFVRDARLAEVTLQTAGPGIDYLGNSPWYFRVFQQSQAIVAAFELLLLAGTFSLWRDKHDQLPGFVMGLHVLLISTILASLSRSFWIGCLAGLALVIASVCLTRPVIVTLIKRHLQLGLLSLVAVVVLFVAITIPIPPRPDLTDSSFYKGRDENTREVAVSSRWNLLRPMLEEIWQAPIIGSGFGETVTFISDDPRLRAVNPSGEVTTYRFEWGYHDLWLKMGILGLLGFGWLLVTVVSVSLKSALRRDQHFWIVVGLASGVVMFYATHIFSPYLNHPIGLGFLIFVLPFLPWKESSPVQAEAVGAISLAPLTIIKPGVGIALKQ